MDKQTDTAMLLNAQRDYQRGQVDDLMRVIAGTSDSLRLWWVAAPYTLVLLACSLHLCLAAAWYDDVFERGADGIKFIVVGMGLFSLFVFIGALALSLIEIAHEWDRAVAIREQIRALYANPQPEAEAEPELPEFPPRWFILFLEDYYKKHNELPTVDEVCTARKAQGNPFNHGVAQAMYESLVAHGAIEDREPHGKSAGKPVWSWEMMLERST